ncbi:MAG: MFS transporter [Acidobacteriaceae bacterium]|nr:MFS transporter [Acidobacteriaceae bacterium]MBV9779915.1 MFS transporter [Acidobacteriaceae bacterium]
MKPALTPIGKPHLRFWQIWNMSFGFLGIQFGWTLQMNNMSAIYEYLGAQPSQLPILWLAAPLTGLIVQPIIGHWSDNTWGPLGRRRPFFLAGALLSSCALVLMPLSSALWMAAGLLWILDASINISMEPFRAFVADMLPDEQRARGFSMQSFFIGLGSVAASYGPWLLRRLFGISGTPGARAVPQIVLVAFWIGAIAFLSAVLVTILTTKEYPPSPQELARLKRAKRFDAAEIFHALRHMPETMRQLAVVQLLTWLGLFCMFLYFAVAVAHNVFGAKSTQEPAFTDGVIWAGYCSGIYNAICFLVSPLLPAVAARIGRRGTHSFCLITGALGLLSIALIHNKWLLFLPMVGVGIAWASILSMPYSILSAAIPSNKMGIYMGIFNFFIVIPEILSSLVFGWVMARLLGNDRMKAIIVGGVCFIIAALLMRRVHEVRIRDESLAPVPIAEAA